MSKDPNDKNQYMETLAKLLDNLSDEEKAQLLNRKGGGNGGGGGGRALGTPAVVRVPETSKLPNQPLVNKIRAALNEQCMDIHDLATVVGMSEANVAAFFHKELIPRNVVAPVQGFGPVGDFFPKALWKYTIWCWCLEENVSAKDRRAFMEKLMKQFPVGQSALSQATKVPKAVVGADVTEIRRHHDDIWEFNGAHSHKNFLFIYPSKKPPTGSVWDGALPPPRQGGRFAKMTDEAFEQAHPSNKPIDRKTKKVKK